VLPEEDAERKARELPLRPGLVRVRRAPIPWIHALAADLAQAGIAYAIDRREVRDEHLLGLYVKEKDRAAAAALEAARLKIDPLEMDGEPTAEESEEEVSEEEVSEEEDEEDYKVCPECGADFRPEIERYAYCDVELVEPGEEEDPDPEELFEEASQERTDDLAFPYAPRHEIPASDDLVCFGCARFSYLARLSAILDAAGIGHRIEPGPYQEQLSEEACLYLFPEDCDAAERAWDAATAVTEDVVADLEKCPFCGASRLPDVPECPKCGLSGLNDLSGTAPPDVICERCGAIQFSVKRTCPNCGSAVPKP
jgi:uncharacterized OB-fold protein